MEKKETDGLGQVSLPHSIQFLAQRPYVPNQCLQAENRSHEGLTRRSREASSQRAEPSLFPDSLDCPECLHPSSLTGVLFPLHHTHNRLNSSTTLQLRKQKPRSFPTSLPLSISLHSKQSLRTIDFTFHPSLPLSTYMAPSLNSHLNLCSSILLSWFLLTTYII